MVETIDKIRIKISKLLIRISNLEKTIVENKKSHNNYVNSLALSLVEKKDALISSYQKEIKSTFSENERNLITQKYKSNYQIIDEILGELNVVQMASPLDTMADFIEVVGTVKKEGKRNGLVVQVIRPGYMIGEDLLRLSQVVVVQND